MIKLLGKKRGMTTLFTEKGGAVPVTILEVGPCPVVQVKTVAKDGYGAVQIGLQDGMKKRSVSKPMAGHIAASGQEALRMLREFKVEDENKYKVGQCLTVADLNPEKIVNVVGTTKGRGFAGVVKRYGFKGGESSHGEEKRHRTGGSLGSSARLTHVWKGKRMCGHMGNVRQTVKNLKIIEMDKDKHLLILKGSVPGYSGCTVEISQK